MFRRFLLFSFIALNFACPINFITIQSKETIKSAEKRILKELKNAKFQNIKVLQYKDQEFSVILFEDKDFLEMAEGNQSLLINIPFKIIISSKEPSKKNPNLSVVSYQDFSELKRNVNSSLLDALASKMLQVIKKSKI